VTNLSDIGRLPASDDNAAIAVRPLRAGTRYCVDGVQQILSADVPVGHRFAVRAIAAGSELTSWGLPFGRALRAIKAGEYLCNAAVLAALRLQQCAGAAAVEPNFEDARQAYSPDPAVFRAGRQLEPRAEPGTFTGFARRGGRGTGTRNDIVILGTSSLSASFAKCLEARFESVAEEFHNIDAIVAAVHTEGGDSNPSNNRDLVLRTLAGFVVHPNVGAVLAVDWGGEEIDNAGLESFLRDCGYPLDAVLHRFFSIGNDFDAALNDAETIVRGWLPAVDAMRRRQRPVSELRIALQCGGSDAFSGISGNPLAGRVAGELIRHGGAAVLAETDELIGAEPYVLANVRDFETAAAFLARIDAFKEHIAWHGHDAEGNPSGGNKLRGLYNIALKSIGAARKKDPDVRLDYVIDYAEPLRAPGFYFMDSPGNDLESIAGQVAAGCNLIFFITGNGSITNFPFVPTIKFITTTERWQLLAADMDVNAGRYLDGTPLGDLADETFALALAIASGTRSVGERAGHSQVSIWRNWRQRDASALERIRRRREPDGRPVPVLPGAASPATWLGFPIDGGFAADQVGLIMPTSLCSGQVALRIAGRLNSIPDAQRGSITRYVALPHTEGCGVSSGENEALYLRTLIGHLRHPFTRHALLLEHGCEKTHNAAIRHALQQAGIDPARFGFASIQLDGGIDAVTRKVTRWFGARAGDDSRVARRQAGLDALSVGISTSGELPTSVSIPLAHLAAAVVGGGGTAVIAGSSPLLDSAEFIAAFGLDSRPAATLGYGQIAAIAGLHVMATPSRHAVETLTGMAATGVQAMLIGIEHSPVQGHPMIPLIQVGIGGSIDLDYDVGNAAPGTAAGELLQLLCEVVSGQRAPHLWAAGNTDFQLTRGLLGVSL